MADVRRRRARRQRPGPPREDRQVQRAADANCAIYSTTLDLTQAANALTADGWHIDPDDLATVTPYITTAIRRFGDWVLNLTPPAETAGEHLALAAAG